MFDGVQIKDLKPKSPLSHLEWQIKVSKKTGETDSKETAQHRGVFLTRYPNGRVILGGSITKYYLGNNVQNMSFLQLVEAISALCNELSIEAKETVLNGLEIGINIKVKFMPEKFIKDLLTWGKIEPQKYLGKKEAYAQFSKSQSTLKIYSKSKQYDLKENLLRYELRFDRMQAANKLGVNTLDDLTNKEYFNNLISSLISTFRDLVYYDDSIKVSELKTTEKRLLLKGNNPKYWSDKELHRNTLKKNRNRFKKIVDAHGKKRYSQIESLLRKECAKLQGSDNKKECAKLPTVQKSTNVHISPLNNVYKCTIKLHDLRAFFNPYLRQEIKQTKLIHLDGLTIGNMSYFLGHHLKILERNPTQLQINRLIKLKTYLEHENKNNKVRQSCPA